MSDYAELLRDMVRSGRSLQLWSLRGCRISARNAGASLSIRISTTVHGHSKRYVIRRIQDIVNTAQDDLLIEQVNKHGHYWQQIVSLCFPGRTSLAAKNRYHILQRRLKSQQTGAARVRGLSNTSWQEIIWSHSPRCDRREQDNSSSATPPDFNALPTSHDHSPFVLDESCPSWPTATSHPIPYPTPGGLEVDSTCFPFPLLGRYWTEHSMSH